MNIDLSNFEAMFGEMILLRGIDYYEGGHVIDIEEIDAGTYHATVEGSKIYEVTIGLSKDHDILQIGCDCPYDGVHCKHQAAALYALRDRLSKSDAADTLPLMERVRNTLSQQTKEALLDTLLDLVREDSSLGHRLLHRLGGEAGGKSLVDAMWESIRRAQAAEGKRHAHTYVEQAKSLIEDVLEIARAEKEASAAIALLFQTLQACDEMAEASYDASDDFSWLAEVAVGQIRDHVERCAKDGDTLKQEALYAAISTGMQALPFRSWDDRLVEHMLPLCTLPACRDMVAIFWENRLREFDGHQESYMVMHIKRQQFSVIQGFGDTQSAEQFIQSNLQYSDFREMAIDAAMQKQDYQTALALALEAERLESRALGNQRRWQQYAYEAYKALGDLPCAQKLAYQFLLGGDFDCFTWLKQSFPETQWGDTLGCLLADLEAQKYNQSVYEKVLVAEGLWDKLMAHIEQTPSRVFSLHEHLLPHYPGRVDKVFQQALIEMAEQSTDRSMYRQLCSRIEAYASACGQPSAEKIIQQFRVTYRRKRALVDELRKAFPV